MSSTNLQTQLTQSLLQTQHLPVCPTWLTTFITNTRQPPPPFPALLSTAHFRILASDITASLSTTDQASLLPSDINNVNVKERRLNGNVVVQVLDIIDLGTSKGTQIEAIERVERGEEVRGREVIRTVPGLDGGNGEGSGANAGGGAGKKRSQGPHKLVLRDATGTDVMGFELKEIPKCWIGEEGMSIGCKIVLKKGVLVRRGLVMLTPESVIVLGGKIESWDRKWREERKVKLVQGQELEYRARGGNV